MSKTKAQKQVMLKELEDSLAKSKSAVFTVNKGINSEDMVNLRKKLYAANSAYVVPKKTLLKIALKNQKIDLPENTTFDGAVNVMFSLQDEIAGIKTIYDLSKNSERIEIIGGIFEKKYIDKNSVMSLATIPSKQELYAKLVYAMNSPISGFVNALSGNLRNFVGVLSAIKDKKASV